jgi:hypothetical protein
MNEHDVRNLIMEELRLHARVDSDGDLELTLSIDNNTIDTVYVELPLGENSP